MSEKRTQGAIRYDFEPGYCGELISNGGKTVATFNDEPSSDDARRLVACWNACEGITTERLEDLGRPLMQHLIGCDERAARQVKETGDLRAHRDALLAALRCALKKAPELITVPVIRSAIENAEQKGDN